MCRPRRRAAARGPAQRAPDLHPPHSSISFSCWSFKCACPFLVRRPRESQVSSCALNSKSSPSASSIRTRTFGGARRPSSQVRHRSSLDPLLSHAALPVLCARVARPFSRLSSSLVVVMGLIVVYSSHCARRCAACIREVPLAGARRLRLCEVSVHVDTSVSLVESVEQDQ